MQQLLKELKRCGVRLALEDGQLSVSARKGSLSAELVAGIRQHKAALLALLSEAPATAKVPALLVAARGTAPTFSLSYMQQRLWYLAQVSVNKASYNMPLVLHLRGSVDVPALRTAFRTMLARHELLGMRVAERDGVPYWEQSGPSDAAFSVEHLDALALLPDQAGDPEMIAHAQLSPQARARLEPLLGAPFALAECAAVRARLLHFHGGEQLFILNCHHIIGDGWSLGVMMRDLCDAYNGRRAASQAGQAQFSDYVRWQGEWLRSPAFFGALSAAVLRLEGAPALINLPTDRPRAKIAEGTGGAHGFMLDGALHGRLQNCAKQLGVTLFALLLAAFKILLANYARQADVVVATPSAGRFSPLLEGTVGYFVNTLAIRSQLDFRISAADFIGQVGRGVLEALAAEQVPFGKLVEAINPARSLGHHPVFQVMFALQNIDALTLDFRELVVTPVLTAAGSSKFDLNLSMRETASGLLGWLEYDSALFESENISRFAACFATVLDSIASDPAQRIGEVRLLAGPEWCSVMKEGNRSTAVYPRDGLIHTVFEAQAAMRSTAVALVANGVALSYAELNRRANRVAHRLLAAGTSPGDRVGLFAGRSNELIIGMLGILKAGGAYVPLDPTYPAERLVFMLSDSAPVALLTLASLCSALPQTDLPLFLLDAGADDADEDQYDLDPQLAVLTALHPAYLMYTSGSTGIPKGVLVHHRGVLRLAINNGFAAITGHDCVAHCSNPAFDAATWEIWGALLNGAQLLVVPHDVALDGLALNATLVAGRVTAMWLTAGLFHAYVDDLRVAFGLLRYLLVGGDVLDPAVVARLLARDDRPQHLLNGYGPTETTTFATMFDMCSWNGDGASVPIGTPINNTTVYILNERMQAVPRGVVGELYVGGDGVALGYLNRDDLTAQRFFADPFALDGARMYKTGDLGRRRADGTIEFIGRDDLQVKMRGFRIELGEIETLLAACDGVRGAAVLAREGMSGDKRLVAYLVADEGVSLSPAWLREQALRSLPEYMVPVAFMILQCFPLTANGKLDRGALPAPDMATISSRDFEPAQNATEIALALIWAELLDIARIGRHDSFFELGGHSLLAVQMIARTRREMGVPATLHQLFAAPVLSQFASALSTMVLESTAHENLVCIRQGHTFKPVFFVHPGEGSVGYVYDVAPYIEAAVPLYALEASGVHGEEVRFETVEEVAARYRKQILDVQHEGPYRIAGWSAGGTIAMAIARQLLDSGRTVEFVGLIDTAADYSFLTRRPEWTRGLSADVAKHLSRMDGEAIAQFCKEQGVAFLDHDLDTLRRHIQIGSAICTALEGYSTPRLELAVHLFVSEHSAAQGVDSAWRAVHKNLSVQIIGGDHFSMMKLPHLSTLGASISRAIITSVG